MRPFDIVVVSHGGLADAMVAAAFMICGPSAGVGALGLDPSDSPESYGERLRAMLDETRPTLILSDLYGGTPHNVACAVARGRSMLRCISGANLGLLIEAITAGEELDDRLVDRLVSLAREGVVDVTSRLSLSRD